MSEDERARSGGAADPATAATAPAAGTIDGGRYCYCLVRLDPNDDPEAMSATGVDDESVRIVAVDGPETVDGDALPAAVAETVETGDRDDDADGTGDPAAGGWPTGARIGAVLHGCERVYDADDPTQVQRWLLSHQGVVDAAAEAFGTPLPFRFDTILEGGDEAVRAWLQDRGDAVAAALSAFAGLWEYRVQVLYEPDVVEETLLERDPELRTLAESVEAAGGGTGFLKGKQYERRLREARSAWRSEQTDRLREAVDGDARAVVKQDREATLADDDRERAARLALLTDASGAERIGERLDDVAAEPGVEIRYTGPWAPYSFAPSFEVSDA